MATPRLPFLYPPRLLKCARLFDSSSWVSCARPRLRGVYQREASRHRDHPRFQTTFSQRYGPAAEPMAPLRLDKSDEASSSPSAQKEEKRPLRYIELEKEKEKDGAPTSSSAAKKHVDNQPGLRSTSTSASNHVPDADEFKPAEPPPPPPTLEPTTKTLEKVLHLEAPTSNRAKQQKPPHLQAPPYVHHFDTYTLVNDLSKGNFTQDQSVTLMKAIRSLLAVNLEMARAGLVSKSDVENVRSQSPTSTHRHLHLSLSALPTLPCHAQLTCSLLSSGILSFPRCLLRAAHRGANRTQSEHRQNAHRARSCSTRWTSYRSASRRTA